MNPSLSGGTGAALSPLSAGVSTNVGTAAVGDDISLSRLTEVGAVGAGHEDSGPRRSGQQGDTAVVKGSLSNRSEGAEPGVAVTGVLQWRGQCQSDTCVKLCHILDRSQSVLLPPF